MTEPLIPKHGGYRKLKSFQIAVAHSLPDRQIAAQAAAFEKEGGFTERLYRTRTRTRGT